MTSSTKRPWMPFYVADYLADTTHLSTEEHGAYVLLLLDYWRNGDLPKEKAQLARIARMTPKEWSKISGTMEKFFTEGWRHKRLDAEIKKAADISDKRREAINQRRDRRPTIVPSNVRSNDDPFVDTLHTTHFTQGPVQADNLSVGDVIRGQRGPNGAQFRHENRDEFGLETEDVFGAGVAQ